MSEGTARWTGARQLTGCVFVLGGLLGSACSIEQPVSGPVALTGEWRTIDPPEPLRVAGKGEQVVCVQIIGTVTDIDLQNGVVVDGQRHVLGGEAIDDEQTTYDLKVGSMGGSAVGTVCLSRAGQPPHGPDFGADIIKLRLRSEPPLRVEKIWWYSGDQK
jgi:hypothetical protein